VRKGEPPELRRLPDELRRRLDEEPATLCAEYLADRLGLASFPGYWVLELRGEGVFLRKAQLHQGPVGVDVIEELAARAVA
jgi:hypothetical protein